MSILVSVIFNSYITIKLKHDNIWIKSLFLGEINFFISPKIPIDKNINIKIKKILFFENR